MNEFQNKKTRNYFKIFEQVYENPCGSTQKLSEPIGISRDVLSNYLEEMYAHNIIRGPYIELKPARNYREFVYLMEFEDPLRTFYNLKRSPHILYHAMLFGPSNILVISNRRMEFSKVRGFQRVVYQGIKGYCMTPKAEEVTWEESLRNIHEKIAGFAPARENNGRIAPLLNWEEDEWKLFSAFGDNIRKKVTPLLRKIGVPYEKCLKWKESITNHCTIHTEFYPRGYRTYFRFCVLFSSRNREYLRKIFSSLPVTAGFMELNNLLLSFINTGSSATTRELFSTLYDMRKEGIITEFSQALMVYQCNHKFLGE